MSSVIIKPKNIFSSRLFFHVLRLGTARSPRKSKVNFLWRSSGRFFSKNPGIERSPLTPQNHPSFPLPWLVYRPSCFIVRVCYHHLSFKRKQHFLENSGNGFEGFLSFFWGEIWNGKVKTEQCKQTKPGLLNYPPVHQHGQLIGRYIDSFMVAFSSS